MNSFSIVSPATRTVQRAPRPMRPISILVATDGSVASSHAYAAADLIVAGRSASVHLLSVVRSLPVIVPPIGALTPLPGIDRTTTDAVERNIRNQLTMISRSADWNTETRVGDPASVIAEAAKDQQADLIVIGESHHGALDRLLGEETCTRLVKRVNVPLLVASASMQQLPRQVVVAFELGSSDFRTLVRTLEILGSPPSVSCVHVQPRSELLGVDWAEYDAEYSGHIDASFEKMRKALGAIPEIRPELVVLHGDPATEITAFAERVKSEMTIIGLRQRREFALTPGGGTAMKVVRASHRSVLLVPRTSTKAQSLRQ